MKYALLLLLCGCISGRQVEMIKSHAAETGTATTFGIVSVLVGGPPGILVAFVGMGFAAVVGEVTRPPAQVLEHTKTIDKNGNVTDAYQYFTPKQGGEKTMPEIGFLHSIVSWFDSLLKIGVALAFAFWLITHPKVLEKLVGVAASGVQLAKNAAKTVQKGIHPIASKKQVNAQILPKPKSNIDEPMNP